jgi:protein-tyrosine phosphatase
MPSIERSTQTTPQQRTFSLEGGCNFRDIGGYRTRDGRIVKWGQVFRAGVLSYVTDADHRSLQPLGIRAICDLRRADERRKEPTNWPHDSTRAFFWEDEIDVRTLRSFAAERPATPEGMFDAMVAMYRGLPRRLHTRMHGLLSCIAEGTLPLVVHCAAGKDRTGVAIAILLSILDLPREVIIEDYLLTNEVGDFEGFIRSRERTELGLADANHPLLAMPTELRRVLLSAHPDFLTAAFAQIDEELGGFDAYVEKTLRIPSAMRERIVSALLDAG